MIHNAPEHINLRVALLETLTIFDPKSSSQILVSELSSEIDDLAYTAVTLLNENAADSEFVLMGISNTVEGNLISVERLSKLLLFGNATALIAELSDIDVIAHEIKRQCALPGMEKYAILVGDSAKKKVTPKSQTMVWAIDDSKMILRMYENYAVEKQFTLRTFESGEAMLSELQSEKIKPALFFIDLNMPGMTGIEVASALMETSSKDIPRFLVTTQTDAREDSEMQESLFTDIIQKPFTADTLSTIVNNVH